MVYKDRALSKGAKSSKEKNLGFLVESKLLQFTTRGRLGGERVKRVEDGK